MSEDINVHYSMKSNEWTTPQLLYDYLNKKYNFTLDPCATHDNAKCDKYFTIKENGLIQDWSCDTVFMNPPYGKGIKHWVKKAYHESQKGAIVVCLIPARTDTMYWHNFIFYKASDIIFIKGRIKFGDGSGKGAPFPSAIIVFDPSKPPTSSYRTLEQGELSNE